MSKGLCIPHNALHTQDGSAEQLSLEPAWEPSAVSGRNCDTARLNVCRRMCQRTNHKLPHVPGARVQHVAGL